MKRFLKWGLIIFVALIVIGVIGSAGKSGNTTQTSGTKEAPTVAPKPMEVTAQQIADDFDSNQVAAEKEWSGKYVQFSATISNITDSGISFTNVASKQYSFTQISCRTKDKQQLLSLKNGETTTVKGIVGKQLIGVIEVNDCEVVK